MEVCLGDGMSHGRQGASVSGSGSGSGSESGGRSIEAIPSDAVALARLTPALTDRPSADGRGLHSNSITHSPPEHPRNCHFHRCSKEAAVDDCVMNEARPV